MRWRRHARLRSLVAGSVAAGAALAGACLHDSVNARRGTLAEFARALPTCPAQSHVWNVSEVAGSGWVPGSRVLVRGHLAVVSFGPPCPDDPSTSGQHCGVTWSLWGTPAHPAAFADLVSGEVLTLAGALPRLVDERDRQAAQTAIADIEVTVAGTLPDRACDPANGGALIQRQCPVYPSRNSLAVTEICRARPG
jgi:hypothetical protein